MISTTLTAVLLVSTGTGTPPALMDPPLRDYYDRAVIESRKEPEKALGMLALLLVPDGTRIAADFSALPSDIRPQFERGIRRGYELWKYVLGNDMPFVLTADNDPFAQAKVRFVDKVRSKSPDAKGEIRATRRISWNARTHFVEFEAEIEIAKMATSRRFFSEREVSHVMAHELGHALGLGDVRKRDRIMGPVVIGDPYARLNPSEVSAVRNLRTLLRAQMASIKPASSAGGALTVQELPVLIRSCSHR